MRLFPWARSVVPVWLIAALGLLLAACGSGSNVVKSGSGESGVGGTGISLVKGNVSNIDGAGQGSEQFAKTTVAAGNSRSQLDSNGNFILPGVEESEKLALNFSSGDGTTVTLPVGPLTRGATIEITDVQISYVAGTVTARAIRLIPADEEGDSDSQSNTQTASNPASSDAGDETPVNEGGGNGSGGGGGVANSGGDEGGEAPAPPAPAGEGEDSPAGDTAESNAPDGSGVSGSGSNLGAILNFLYNEFQERRDQQDNNDNNDDDDDGG